MIRKSLLLFYLPLMLMAGDLVVDKNALSKYQRDNYYLKFDPFKYDLHYEGGS